MATIEKEKALDVVKQMVADGQVSQEVAEKYFPELAESWNGKIKKAILSGLKYLETELGWDFVDGVDILDAYAWLEKQGEPVEINPTEFNIRLQALIGKFGGLPKEELIGSLSFWMNLVQNDETYKDEENQDEHKHTDKVKPKFHEGEWVFIEEITGYKQGPFQIKSVDKFGYNFDEYHIIPLKYEELLSKWTIQDAKDGDVLTSGDLDYILIFEKLLSKNVGASYCHYDFGCSTPQFNFNKNTNWYFGKEAKVHPATKEQRDTLMKAMDDAGYTFNFERKELKKIEQSHVEEVNGEDYGIDGLWHAQRILEKTLGGVDGYQSDDGILDHKAAITAVKKLYEQRPAEWSEEDEQCLLTIQKIICDSDTSASLANKLSNWVQSLKDRIIQPRQEWSEEDEKCIRLSMDIIESALRAGFCVQLDRDRCVDWLQFLRLRRQWKPSEELITYLHEAIDIIEEQEKYSIVTALRELLEQIKQL